MRVGEEDAPGPGGLGGERLGSGGRFEPYARAPETLAERIASEGRIAPLTFADWFVSACVRLSQAHEQARLHGCLEPARFLLTPRGAGHALVDLDFDDAASSERRRPLELHGACGAGDLLDRVVGAAHFTSPEAVRGERIDHRSDLWSMAAIAYLALTGRVPFEAETAAELGARIERDTPVAPSKLTPGLSTEVDAWMRIALAKEPGRRFPSALELASAFGEAVMADSGA